MHEYQVDSGLIKINVLLSGLCWILHCVIAVNL